MRAIASESVGRPASAGAATGGLAANEEPMQVAQHELELTYEHGVELEARSQWAYARMRFFRHKLAVTSLIILIGFWRSRSSPAGSRPTRRTGNRLRRELPERTEPGSGRGTFPSAPTSWAAITSAASSTESKRRSASRSWSRALDVHRHRDRRGRRLLRRGGRQRAHALHGPDPHGAGSRRPARRRRVPRFVVGQRAARRHVVRNSAADGDWPHPRVPLLDRDRAHRARPVHLTA